MPPFKCAGFATRCAHPLYLDPRTPNEVLRVLPLEGPRRQFVGLHVSRANPNFPEASDCVLNSPRDRKVGAVIDAMMALYPRFEKLAAEEEITNPNFVPPVL